MIRVLKPLFFIVLFITPFMGHGQADSVKMPYRVVDIKLHGGNHLYTGRQLEDLLENGYGALEVRYGWQMSESDEWASMHKYPTWGVGWYIGYIGDPDVFGNPNAVYGWINLPLSRPDRRNQFEFGLGLGVTYNLIPFDPEDNPTNDAIGARLAAYFNANIGGVYSLNREMDFLYSFDLTHFSNGRTVQPNYGLNMIGFNVGLRYHFNRNNKFSSDRINPSEVLAVRPDRTKTRKPNKTGDHSISFYQAVGTVQNRLDAGTSRRYVTSTSMLEYNYSISERSGLTFGFDYFIDPSVSDVNEEPAYAEHGTTQFPGVHIGYDYKFWKFTVRLQAGTMITEAGQDIKDGAFLRPAFKYDISEVFYGQFGLKTYRGATADWFEFGVGIRLVKF